LFAAHPHLETLALEMADPTQAIAQSESLRKPVPGVVDPGPKHWRNLQLTLFQQAVLKNPAAPDFDSVFSAESLHRFAYVVPSAPFLHPVSLACLKRDPVSVLVQKCVPNRCQLRSLIDEISKTIHLHRDARDFLEQGVHCSLLGLFPGATPPSLTARAKLVRESSFFESAQSLSPSQDSIISTLLRLRCHQTLFFALKETVIYLVNECHHTLRVVLDDYHGWTAFCRLVRAAMDRARASLSGDKTDFEKFERTLQHVSKQKIRRLFSQQPGARDFEKELIVECDKFFVKESTLGQSCHRNVLKRASLRCSAIDVPLHWLRGMAHRPGETDAQWDARAHRLYALVPALQRAKKAFYSDGSKIKLRQALAGRDNTWDNCLVDVSALSRAFRRKRTTHFVRLPAHVAVEQIRALRRVFCVPDGKRETPRLMGVAAFCEECDTFRSFLTPKINRARVSNGLVAFGYEKSLVCDEDPTTFYCGRKPATSEKESSARGAKTGKALRHARFYGKHCSDTKLTFVNLIGRLLVFRSKIYGICCFCANYFMLQGDSWHGASLCCGRCIDAQGRKLYETAACDWCGKRCRSTNLTQLWTTDKKRRALCKACSKPAYANAPTYSLDWQIMCNELCGVSKHKH
jgi:hypothetical protein